MTENHLINIQELEHGKDYVIDEILGHCPLHQRKDRDNPEQALCIRHPDANAYCISDEYAERNPNYDRHLYGPKAWVLQCASALHITDLRRQREQIDLVELKTLEDHHIIKAFPLIIPYHISMIQEGKFLIQQDLASGSNAYSLGNKASILAPKLFETPPLPNLTLQAITLYITQPRGVS